MALFGSSASSDADGANPEAERRKLVLVGIAGVALIALAAFFLLPMILGGSSSTSAGSSSPLPRRAAAAPTSPTSPTPTPAFVLAPAAVQGDPFQPLPEEAAAAAAAAPSVAPTIATVAGTSPAPGSTDGGTPATVASPAPTDSAGTNPSSSFASTSNTPAKGKPVQVVAINGASANIQIDSKAYTVKAGSTPVPGYTVKTVGSGKLTISHDGTVHTLIVGEQQTF